MTFAQAVVHFAGAFCRWIKERTSPPTTLTPEEELYEAGTYHLYGVKRIETLSWHPNPMSHRHRHRHRHRHWPCTWHSDPRPASSKATLSCGGGKKKKPRICSCTSPLQADVHAALVYTVGRARVYLAYGVRTTANFKAARPPPRYGCTRDSVPTVLRTSYPVQFSRVVCDATRGHVKALSRWHTATGANGA